VKGVILCGGLGTRLQPLTRITNKHLLPVYDRPMVFYPIQTLVKAGIKDILVVTGGHRAGDFLNLLRNGQDFGLSHINYAFQEGNGGIADALRYAKPFVGDERFAVILGDGIFEEDFTSQVRMFESHAFDASFFLKDVNKPEDYGVALMENEDTIKAIVEKPREFVSDLAVTGLYFYTPKVFKVIETVKPSARNELEITDVNNELLKDDMCWVNYVHGYWIDCGASVEALFQASEFIARRGRT
jgi:glucose-1-phosphate thymidylyltransferase